MKRLTVSDGLFCNLKNEDDINKAIGRLAEYEDLEEQGLLLKMPCKPGDMLYCLRKCVPTVYRTMSEERTLESDAPIVPARVVSVKTVLGRKMVKVALIGKCHIFEKYADGGDYTTRDTYEYCSHTFPFRAIGVSAFLNMEDAERAAKEV
jgi:hypothetical protein